MSEHGETTAPGDLSVPGTVWRVSLAWPATDAGSRQERVDGLQQLLSTRSVVGLMGPGRPTRAGLIVDLVLPVDQDRVIVAKRDGELEAGPNGEEFAQILHRYTGAVVVNGDVARGDFAVLAAADSLTDQDLTQLLDEPLDDVLLVGTQSPDAVKATAEQLGASAWIASGERPAAAFPEPSTDPTSMVMPAADGLSLAIRERPGRVDLLLWSNEGQDEARPSRRRRSARRNALVVTHLGARCRPIVLPEYVRPAGSPAATLLLTLDEDFSPLASAALARLGRVLPAGRVDALARIVNEAETCGFDPEAGVLAAEQDGLLPGETEDPEPPAHHDLKQIVDALGMDPSLLGLLKGEAPEGSTLTAVGSPAPSAVTASMPHPDMPGEALPESEAAEQADADAQDPAAGQDPDADEQQAGGAAAEDAAGEPTAPTQRSDSPSGTEEAPDQPATDSDPDEGGFTSLLHRGGHQPSATAFDDLLKAQESADGSDRPQPHAAELSPTPVTEAAHFDEAAHYDPEATPQPTPAVGTPASAAGDDSALAKRRRWPMILTIVGLVLIVAAVALVFVAPSLGVAVGSGYIIAGALGVVGLGAGILGAVNLRR